MKTISKVTASAITMLLACFGICIAAGCGSNAQSTSGESNSSGASDVREISGVATSADQSIIWAGDEVTGIVQIPVDWAVVGPKQTDEYDYQYLYQYQGPNSETLDISLKIGVFSEEADKITEDVSSKDAVSLNGHDAVKVVSANASGVSKAIYFVNRPGVDEGVASTSIFEFSYKGQQPEWIEAAMSALILSDTLESGCVTLTDGSSAIGKSKTQWAGNESAGFVSVSNAWTPTIPESSGKMMAYYTATEPGVEGATDATHLGVGAVGSMSGQNVEKLMKASVPNAQDLSTERVRVNGFDGSLVTCRMDSDGLVLHFAYCYLDKGTLIAISYRDGYEVNVDEILATYTESK